MDSMNVNSDEQVFPRLGRDDVQRIAKLGERVDFKDGEYLLHAGDADIDFFVIEEGEVEIRNPAADNAKVTIHLPGEFVGDIDLLTRRPVIVDAIAVGPTRVIRVPGKKLRRLLLTVPHLGEKLLVAIQLRRERLNAGGPIGMRVVGSSHCSDTNLVREFLHKNFVPFTWYDSETDAGREAQESMRTEMKADGHLPWIECGDNILIRPTVRQLAECAGVWRGCPTEAVNLLIIGAGPAGIAAAVYAASEGLSTVVLDELGPGGQAGGSSMIENFIGFPSGLSGGELATRGVLQMLKFGAQIVAPVKVESVKAASTPGEPHEVKTSCGATVRADVVLIATGAKWKRLAAKNADRFDRIGVHYACTSVESQLYEDCDVAVVGAANSAGQAAMFLAETCARTVHLVIRGPELGPGMSSYLADRIRNTANIKIHTGAEIAEVHGTSQIEAITLMGRDGGDRPDGCPERIELKAIFVFIGAEPRTDGLPEEIAKDSRGYILTGGDVVHANQWHVEGRGPCPLETSIPGILAAGDVRCGSTKRVGFAVGDGSLAVTCTHSLLGIIRQHESARNHVPLAGASAAAR